MYQWFFRMFFWEKAPKKDNSKEVVILNLFSNPEHMKQSILILTILIFSSSLFTSCESCVKQTAKKATEIGISAVEGITEALDEHGEKLAEKITDAAGTIALGVGRSLDRQLNEHAATVASVAGRTVVQTVDGFAGGFNTEVESYYDELPYQENFASGVSLDFLGKYKTHPVVDAYFLILEKGDYACTFECYDAEGKVFLTKEAEINKEEGDRKYSLVSFALNSPEEEAMKNLKEIRITVKKI